MLCLFSLRFTLISDLFLYSCLHFSFFFPSISSSFSLLFIHFYVIHHFQPFFSSLFSAISTTPFPSLSTLFFSFICSPHYLSRFNFFPPSSLFFFSSHFFSLSLSLIYFTLSLTFIFLLLYLFSLLSFPLPLLCLFLFFLFPRFFLLFSLTTSSLSPCCLPLSFLSFLPLYPFPSLSPFALSFLLFFQSLPFSSPFS